MSDQNWIRNNLLCLFQTASLYSMSAFTFAKVGELSSMASCSTPAGATGGMTKYISEFMSEIEIQWHKIYFTTIFRSPFHSPGLEAWPPMVFKLRQTYDEPEYFYHPFRIIVTPCMTTIMTLMISIVNPPLWQIFILLWLLPPALPAPTTTIFVSMIILSSWWWVWTVTPRPVSATTLQRSCTH